MYYYVEEGKRLSEYFISTIYYSQIKYSVNLNSSIKFPNVCNFSTLIPPSTPWFVTIDIIRSDFLTISRRRNWSSLINMNIVVFL